MLAADEPLAAQVAEALRGLSHAYAAKAEQVLRAKALLRDLLVITKDKAARKAIREWLRRVDWEDMLYGFSTQRPQLFVQVKGKRGK